MIALGLFLLLLLSFLSIFLVPASHRSVGVVAMFLVFVISHHAVSIINTNFIILPGADYDAHYFHLNALRALENQRVPIFTIGTGVYEWIIYSLYAVFGASKLLSQSFNVLFAVLSSVAICRIASIVDHRVSYIPILGLLAIFPSILFFTSITFREVFQLFGFALGCLYFFKAINDKQMKWLVVSFLSLMFMGAFHHVLLIIAVLMSVMSFCIYAVIHSVKDYREILKIILLGVAFLFLGSTVVLFFPASNGNDYLEMLQHSGSVQNMIDQYRHAVDSANPRSSYGFAVDTSGIGSVLAGLLRSYIFYLVGFWPSESARWVDFVPLAGGLLRFIGLGCFFYLLFTRRLGFYNSVLFLMFVGMSFTWSMGTTNFGQAFRHNVLTDWIPVIWISIVLIPTAIDSNEK